MSPPLRADPQDPASSKPFDGHGSTQSRPPKGAAFATRSNPEPIPPRGKRGGGFRAPPKTDDTTG